MRGPISGSHATVCGGVSQNTGSSGIAVAAEPSAPFCRHFGPDLAGPFIGDTGAFGIKTRCTLALEPIPAGAAFALVAFDTLAAMTAAMLAIARSGIPCRLLGMDPVKNRSAARSIGLGEGLGTLASVVKSAGSLGAGLRQAAGIATAGERWIPVHGIFPLSRAAMVVERTESLLAAQAPRLQADTWSVVSDLKQALDPQRTVNPGNLGLD